jgi:hypothetical protein
MCYTYESLAGTTKNNTKWGNLLDQETLNRDTAFGSMHHDFPHIPTTNSRHFS